MCRQAPQSGSARCSSNTLPAACGAGARRSPRLPRRQGLRYHDTDFHALTLLSIAPLRDPCASDSAFRLRPRADGRYRRLVLSLVDGLPCRQHRARWPPSRLFTPSRPGDGDQYACTLLSRSRHSACMCTLALLVSLDTRKGDPRFMKPIRKFPIAVATAVLALIAGGA